MVSYSVLQCNYNKNGIAEEVKSYDSLLDAALYVINNCEENNGAIMAKSSRIKNDLWADVIQRDKLLENYKDENIEALKTFLFNENQFLTEWKLSKCFEAPRGSTKVILSYEDITELEYIIDEWETPIEKRTDPLYSDYNICSCLLKEKLDNARQVIQPDIPYEEPERIPPEDESDY